MTPGETPNIAPGEVNQKTAPGPSNYEGQTVSADQTVAPNDDSDFISASTSSEDSDKVNFDLMTP